MPLSHISGKWWSSSRRQKRRILKSLIICMKKKKKRKRIVQTAKEVGDGRSDGHYIWQATANCCDADCILAKFLEFIESLTQGPQLKSKGKVWVTQNVKVMNKCNGCIARRISWWIVFGSFFGLDRVQASILFHISEAPAREARQRSTMGNKIW